MKRNDLESLEVEFEKIARDDPYAYACLRMAQAGTVTKEHAYLLCVCRMHDAMERYRKIAEKAVAEQIPGFATNGTKE